MKKDATARDFMEREITKVAITSAIQPKMAQNRRLDTNDEIP